MKPVFIYALRCPLSAVARYVGKTDFPDRRLQVHLRTAPHLETHCGRWINSLLSKNLVPVMEILDVVPDDEANFWEREYLQNFRERGALLTNLTSGGDGSSCGAANIMFGRRGAAHPAFGYRHTHEARRKISEGKLGARNPMFGKPPTDAARARQIAGQLGRKVSAETRRKKSLLMRGENNPMFGTRKTKTSPL